jgi:katanin p80 WD40 repeat-containing subunit B1
MLELLLTNLVFCWSSADEFVAHTGAVNCLRIGRNTAGVLATGGEDKKVNLWRIGQPHVFKVW